MSLVVTVQINQDSPIAMLTIQRMRSGQPAADDVNPYHFTFYEQQGEKMLGVTREGDIEHRYGDGAWVLVSKALDADEVRATTLT